MCEKLKVLVVDDSQIAAKQITMVLEPLGADITYAQDGKMAQEALKKHHFDLVTLDINMPNMSGIELLEKLKHKAIKPYILIVSANQSQCIQALVMGADRALNKPFENQELVKYVEEAKEHIYEARKSVEAGLNSQP